MTLWGPTSCKVLQLPRGLPRGNCRHLGGRRGNLLVERMGDARHLYTGQRMRLGDHLLLVVRQGYLRLKIENIQLKIEAGNAVLLSDLEFEVSELVAPGHGVAAFSWFFFDDSMLGRVMTPSVSGIQHFQGHAQHPSSHKVILFEPVQISAIEGLEQGNPAVFLQRLLNVSFNEFYPPMVKLLVHRIMIPRLKVWLFVENLIFLERAQRRQFCERFPGGARALGRELGRLALPSLERLIAQRRRELRSELRRRRQRPPVRQPHHEEMPAVVRPYGVDPSYFPEVEPGDGGESFLERGALTFTGRSDDDRSISGALPRGDEERKELLLVQKEQVQEVLSSKIIQFPGMDVYKEMLLAA